MQPQSSVPTIDFELVRPLIWLGAVFAAVIAVGALVVQQPFVAIATIFAVPATAMMLRYRDAAIVMAIFLMFANVPAVAVKFHGVPSALAMAVLAPMLLPLAYDILLRREPFIVTPTLPWVLGFIAVQFISANLSTVPIVALETVKTSITEGLIIYFVFTNVLRNQETLQRAIWAVLAAGTFMGALSVFQQATHTIDNDYGGFAQVSDGEGFYVESGRGEIRQRRLAGPIGEKNRYAQTMLMLVPFGLITIWTDRSRREKVVAGIASAFIILAFVLTFSRGSTLGFLLMLMLSTAMGFIKPKQLGAVAIAGLIVLLALPQYRTRLATIPSALGVFQTHGTMDKEPDGAVRGRVTEMKAAANIWLDYPIWGVGPDLSQQFTRQYGMIGGHRALEGNRKAHCLYVELLAEVGLVGTAVFGMMMFASIRQLMFIRRQHAHSEIANLSAAFLLAILSYLTTAIFLHFSYVRFFWMILAMADSTSYVASRQSVGEVSLESVPEATK